MTSTVAPRHTPPQKSPVESVRFVAVVRLPFRFVRGSDRESSANPALVAVAASRSTHPPAGGRLVRFDRFPAPYSRIASPAQETGTLLRAVELNHPGENLVVVRLTPML